MGIGVDTTSLLMRYTFAGDVNLDGMVNIADLSILAANWQASPRFWYQGNVNFDLVVNIADLSILAANWQAGATAGAFSDTAVADAEEEEEDVIVARAA